MAKAKKLPSGNWRVQLSTGQKNAAGHYQYLSITRPTEKEANFAALEYELKLKKERRTPEKMCLRDAYNRYIQNKDAVLSPSTINGYQKLARNSFRNLMDIPLQKLTLEMVQKEINTEAKHLSAKSIRNAHGLLSAVLREYYPEFALRTTLPQKQKYIPNIPNPEEMQAILQCIQNTDIEIPVLLALWLGLRMSEIRGLKWDCIDWKNEQITIKRAVVDIAGGQALKSTKTYSGTRLVKAPPYILERIAALPRPGEFLVSLSGQAIYKRFIRLLAANGLPHIRFHDLRHANASIMLALNVPDKYAMKRLGHATPNMLKQVYQHTMSQEENKIDHLISDYFLKLIP